MNLTNCWTAVNKDLAHSEREDGASESTAALPSCEDEAHSKLEDLGITSELLQTTTRNASVRSLSNRDCINGTYRIILHRLQKQSDPFERDDGNERAVTEDLAASWGRSMSVHGEPGERRNSFGKTATVSYGGTDAKPKRNTRHASHSRKTNAQLQHQHQTKVCTIL